MPLIFCADLVYTIKFIESTAINMIKFKGKTRDKKTLMDGK